MSPRTARLTLIAAALGALLPALAAHASTPAPPAAACTLDPIPPANPFALATVVPVPRYESIRYRPREHWHEAPPEARGPSRSHGFSQLYGGVLDPDGTQSNSALFGFRAGVSTDDRIQVGIGTDWNHRSEQASVVLRNVPLPGGGTAQQRRELARSSMDLLPMMGLLQLSRGAGLVRPYVGIGGGYEVLFLTAEDFISGDSFDATYGGWGWQAWAGVALPVAGSTRLTAEVFRNTAEVGRDVSDPVSGAFREVVSVNGTGVRAGLSWGF